ncbi:MAG TPA: amidohydrolase family protein, partial [Kofleriaceae bacterium]|nr:amidohydrolase family protein [Kofleriaceae bacterium]
MIRAPGLYVVVALMACRGQQDPLSALPADARVVPATAVPALKPAREITAFVDVTVEPMETPAPLFHQVVLVEGASIVKIAPIGEVQLPPEIERVDGRGKFLIPGLHDMHVHLDNTKGMLALFVASGVTTVRNMAGGMRTIALRDKIAKGELLGPTIYTTGPFVDGERPRWESSASVVTMADAEKVIARHVEVGFDYVKIYNGLTVAAYDAVAAQAKLHNLRIVGHVPFAVPLAHAIAAGQASIEHLSGFAEAVERADSPVRHQRGSASIIKRWMYADPAKITQVAADVAAHHIYNAPTLVTAAAYADLYRGVLPEAANTDLDDVSPDWRARWDPKRSPKHYDRTIQKAMESAHDKALATEGQIVKELQADGDPIMAGTDTPNPYVVPGPSLHQELGLLVGAGLTPFEALRAATLTPAEFLGDPHDGRIAPGAHADLVLLAADPLVDIHAVDKIAGVMVRGRWLSPKDLKAMHDGLVAAYKQPAWEAPLPLGAEAFGARVTQYVVSDNGAPVGAYAIAQRGTTIVERETLEDELSSTKTTLGEHHAQTLAIDVERPEGATHVTYTRKDRALVGWLSPATAMQLVAPQVSKLAIGDKVSFSIDTPINDAPATLERGSITIERMPGSD